MANRPAGPLLVVVPNVGMGVDGARLFLDVKATEGLGLYARHWPGPVRCLCRQADPATIGYGRWYTPDELPFEAVPLDADADVATIAAGARDAALLLAGADDHRDLGLVRAMAPVPVVMVIEYTLRTRLDVARLSAAGTLAKLKTMLWLVKTERPRRRALAEAAGLQANGTPAFAAYGRASRDPLLYFDTRLRTADFIGRDAAAAKAAAVADGQPLRLAFSGRLERMKGADHLVPVARRLRDRAVPFALDIYGDGSLRAGMAAAIAAAGLGGAVTLHGPVDFDSILVPRLKSAVDLFLCPHPQADPSCTYLETLGCGVPIAGFRNAAFRGVLDLGPCGVGVPVGDEAGLAAAVARLHADRTALGRLIEGAAAVAEGRLFEAVFQVRVAHLARVAGLGCSP